MTPTQPLWQRGDPAIPAEFRDMLIRLLRDEHLENNDNPEYRVILANIANAGLRFAPHGRAMEIEAEIVKQEVRHGRIVSELLAGLGAEPVGRKPIKQYAFHIPLEDWIDLAWFHALIDRVGLYVGVEWVGSPYAPLAEVSAQLEADEAFHSKSGFRHLQEICATPEGKAAAQERLQKWWTAALDMFGKSSSTNSPIYVKWGIKQHTNEQLRRKYIAEALPEIAKLGLEPADDMAGRRFL